MVVGKATRANVEEYTTKMGFSPVQINGIPEGFSFVEPDIQIGNQVHKGRYIAFIPLSDCKSVEADDTETLLQAYKIEYGTK